MLKKIKHADPQHYSFIAVLLFSIVLHAIVLSQLQWKARLPDKAEVIFEVQLLEPEKKPIPPKPEPVVIRKAEPIKVKPPEKPLLVKKQTAKPSEAGKPVTEVKVVAEPEKPKPPPVKPVPKPSLSITSDVGQPGELKESPVSAGPPAAQPPASRPLISRIDVPESRADDQVPLATDKLPAPSLSVNPEMLKHESRRDDLIPGKIAESSQQTDIKSEIRSQKEPIRYKIVEQTVDGKSSTSGSKETGEDMIEGEVKQRKVIYKPDPPVLNIESDVTITLKFTVLPNGEVDQIFPYRKAGPELERLAMQLLRQYRFEPLFENDKIQQGIIHFSIYRNKNR
ncbi:hypothetical protein KKI24_30810 [bacterium]|nr:hypothetical protein [bacterium]